jgi:hypothetical protein
MGIDAVFDVHRGLKRRACGSRSTRMAKWTPGAHLPDRQLWLDREEEGEKMERI